MRALREQNRITKNNINRFLFDVNNFHDTVIMKIEYVSGSKILKDSVFPINDLREVIVDIGKPGMKMRLYFSEVEELHLKPRLNNFDSIIYECNLNVEDQFVYWSDNGDSTVEVPGGNFWIKARYLQVEYF